MAKKGIGLKVTSQAKEYLLENGYDSKNGVRPMRRLIQDTIEDYVALQLIDDQYQKGDIVKVGAGKNELAYSVQSES